MTATTVSPADIEEIDEELSDDRPWVTVVWNDPINLMSYVTYVFQKLFGYDKATAQKLMLDVHRKGRASVSNGTRDEMERDAARLHTYGLWATVIQD
ncbi:ATP-dependent Clp protease adapter ClpS [Pseudofrankia asymbiotica]|uniref:ATP-dependent Clp protease adapter protein ClpS n=1 Tax=Pseudofrankia asymbiotica TaxID=1834516 RepID=A0A1V2IB06_9ACTN|nr:ATP-dependent Clp protease adapter ClpS [Pseudofrankia asymbiotica]ONH29771.1 ATP-dependent Clp protease adapter ClpS [Pseudofrankia asymbiotica]